MSHRLQNGSLPGFDHGHNLLPPHGWEAVQKVFDRFPALQRIDQVLQWNSRAGAKVVGRASTLFSGLPSRRRVIELFGSLRAAEGFKHLVDDLHQRLPARRMI